MKLKAARRVCAPLGHGSFNYYHQYRDSIINQRIITVTHLFISYCACF